MIKPIDNSSNIQEPLWGTVYQMTKKTLDLESWKNILKDSSYCYLSVVCVGAGVIHLWVTSCGFWKPNLGPLQGQELLITTEPSL